jgi:hypothetical protein
MDGRFTRAEDSLDRTPAKGPCTGCQKSVGKTQLRQEGEWRGHEVASGVV